MAPPVTNPARMSFQWFLCSVTLTTPTSTARDRSTRHKVGFIRRVPLVWNTRVTYIWKTKKKTQNEPSLKQKENKILLWWWARSVSNYPAEIMQTMPQFDWFNGLSSLIKPPEAALCCRITAAEGGLNKEESTVMTAGMGSSPLPQWPWTDWSTFRKMDEKTIIVLMFSKITGTRCSDSTQ